MSPLETYLFLFADSFITGLALPVREFLVFTAMQIFGGYNMPVCAIIHTFGITLAATLNWLLGKMLRSLKKHNNKEPERNNSITERTFTFLYKYGHFAALSGFIPVFGPLVIVFTGLIRASFKKVILLVFITNLLFSYWQIL